MARPVKFDSEAKERALRVLAAVGMPTRAAKAAGVTLQTLRQHYHADPEFRAAYDEAMAEHRDALYEVALDVARSNSSVLLALLRRADPGFRDRVQVEASVDARVEQPAQVIEADYAALSDGELEQLEALQRKALGIGGGDGG